MSVQSLFYSDRDGKDKALNNPEDLMFATKAEADKHDRMLEHSECLQEFLRKRIKDVPEEKLEEICLEISKNPDLIKQSFKKPSVLTEGES